MSKSNTLFSNPAFQKNAEPTGFNLVTQNNFNSIINYQPLDKDESQIIEKLMWESIEPEWFNEDQTEMDLKEIKTLTAEIKSIGRQGILLIGERVFKAREILKNYRTGTFTKWLEAAFDSRKTGYNLLAYYELFSALPFPDLKEKFKKIPQKAAYILASRDGSLDIKSSIINEYYDLTAHELIEIIHEQFPLATKDRRQSSKTNVELIKSLYDIVKKLQKRKKNFTKDEIKELKTIRDILNLILE